MNSNSGVNNWQDFRHAILAMLSVTLLWGCSVSPTANDTAGDTPSSEVVQDLGTETAAELVIEPDTTLSPEDFTQELSSEDLTDSSTDNGGQDVQDTEVQDVPVQDSPSCDCQAPTLSVSVNNIPDSMNGSKPFTNTSGDLEPFHLALPTHGFVWNVEINCPCGCPAEFLSIYADSGSEPTSPAEELAHLFTAQGSKFSYMVSPEHSLAVSDSTLLWAQTTDQCGQTGEAQLEVEVHELTAQLHPFDLQDPWLMVYKRDHQTINWHLDADLKGFITADFAPNGISDFLEDLWTFGLGTANPTVSFSAAIVDGGSDGNDSIARTLLKMTREKAYGAYLCAADGSKDEDSVNIRFLIQDEPEAPSADDFAYQFLQPEDTEKSFSMIGFGGGDLNKSLVGLSETIDEWNIQNENNAKFGYGCLTSSLSRFFYQYVYEDDALYALAATVLAEVLPAMGGTPIGEMEGDDLVIDLDIPASELPSHLASRRTVYEMLLDALSAGLGALMAHEIGHSLGLVAYGPPPQGLFGSEKHAEEFVVNPDGCAGAHLDTDGPNLMAAGPGSGNMGAFNISILFTPFFFNELNLAYLQGRVLLTP